MDAQKKSSKNLVILVVVFILVVLGFILLNNTMYGKKEGNLGKTYKDAEYIIDGQAVKLSDGYSEVEAALGSASKIITRYFGNEVKYDFDKDGREDVAFLLTQETGGSGVFFYVVAALNKEDGYVGSQGLLLGDRIAPQTTEISQNPNHKDVIVVNYMDRNPGEAMTTSPSLGRSIWLKLDIASMQFGEVVQDFPGEADPQRMTLGMHEWTWSKTNYNDGEEFLPEKPSSFKITFSKDGNFSAKTDCNSVSGQYVVNGQNISFSQMVSTLMYCEGSQESDFVGMLSDVSYYNFTSKGELILDIKSKNGSMIFK
ncbi:MAG: META domain-containing protein [Candidatus Paceibacterota bacterium]